MKVDTSPRSHMCTQLTVLGSSNRLCTTSITQNPVPHQWAGPRVGKKKKKWCNVCRLRIHSKDYFCQGLSVCLSVCLSACMHYAFFCPPPPVCRLYAHKHCMGQAFNTCKQCAANSTIADVCTLSFCLSVCLSVSVCLINGKGETRTMTEHQRQSQPRASKLSCYG